MLVALIIFDIPFHVDVHFEYDEKLAELNSFGGLQLSLTTLCIVGIYSLWFADLCLKRFSLDVSGSQVNRWLVLYLAAVSVSAFFAPRGDMAVYEIAMLGQTFLLYFYALKRIRSRDDIFYVTSVLVISFLIQALLMIGVYVTGASHKFGPWYLRIDGNRVAGTVGSPNTAASFLELLIVPSLALFQLGGQAWQRNIALIAFLTGATALLLTFSRGGWLAAISSVSLFCFFAWRSGWFSLRIPLTIAAFVAVVFLPVLPLIFENLLGEQRADAQGRLIMMDLALRVVADNIWLGVGANNFATVMETYVVYPEFVDAWIHTVHNKYLLVCSENGIIGLVGFVGFLISTVILGFKSVSSKEPLLSAIAVGFACAILGQMLHMNLDLFNTRPQTQLLWIICALVACIYSTTAKSKSSHEEEHRLFSPVCVDGSNRLTSWEF